MLKDMARQPRLHRAILAKDEQLSGLLKAIGHLESLSHKYLHKVTVAGSGGSRVTQLAELAFACMLALAGPWLEQTLKDMLQYVITGCEAEY